MKEKEKKKNKKKNNRNNQAWWLRLFLDKIDIINYFEKIWGEMSRSYRKKKKQNIPIVGDYEVIESTEISRERFEGIIAGGYTSSISLFNQQKKSSKFNLDQSGYGIT